MNLATLIAKRAEEGQPIRVGMIGAGKFGTMFLAQAERQRGILQKDAWKSIQWLFMV